MSVGSHTGGPTRRSRHVNPRMDALDKRVYAVVGGLGAIMLFAILGWWYYSFMWSEWTLSPVRVGMSRNQVRALVGPPLHTRTNDWAEVWSYTRSWSRDANVYFDTNGVLWIETD